MRRIFDAISIGTISAAINVAAGGSWFSWLLLNLSLAWLYRRLAPPPGVSLSIKGNQP